MVVLENVKFNQNRRSLRISSLEKFTVVEFYGSNTFTGKMYSSYATLQLKSCNVTFYGNITFLQKKGLYGGAFYAEDSDIIFQESVIFQENEGKYGGALMLYRSVAVFRGDVSFVRNHAQESGGAVYARDSQIIISVGQKLSFVENEGYDGGAMALVGDSTMYLEANSSVVFVSNHAYHYGGAIHYVDDYTEYFEPAAEVSKCFYGVINTRVAFTELRDVFNYVHKIHLVIEFYNNTAVFAGTAIYGGWVDLCMFYMNYQLMVNYEHEIYLASVFDSLFHLHQSTQQLSLISSNPTHVCLCTNMSIPDCSIKKHPITAYPGETFTILAVAVGQRFGTVPSTVHSNFGSRDNGRLPELIFSIQYNDVNLQTMHVIESKQK